MSKLQEMKDRLEDDMLTDLLSQCTPEQQAFFTRMYPGGPRREQIPNAISQCERTIAKNLLRKEGSA